MKKNHDIENDSENNNKNNSKNEDEIDIYKKFTGCNI